MEQDKIIKLRQDILRLEEIGIKPNYSELSRVYNHDRRTIKKYAEGYEGKSKTRKKKSVLDKDKDFIKEKLKIPGIRVSSLYQYFKGNKNYTGSESNFRHYINKAGLKPEKGPVGYPRFETEPGKQGQFDWKEKLLLVSKYGEVFEFNIFVFVLGYSRKHIFVYSKTRTREDVIRCLIESYKELNGVPLQSLTDNMSSIINNNNFCKEILSLSKDFTTEFKNCRIYSPQTKGKVESKNRFINWLKPYNNEFVDEKELIEIIKSIENEANKKINDTTGVPPSLLFEKEKEYLLPLPSKEIIESHLSTLIPIRVDKTSLIHYKGNKYSVPPKYINKTLKYKEINNELHIYNNTDLIKIHKISNSKINYDKDDYQILLKTKLNKLPEEDIDEIALKNLESLSKLGGNDEQL